MSQEQNGGEEGRGSSLEHLRPGQYPLPTARQYHRSQPGPGWLERLLGPTTPTWAHGAKWKQMFPGFPPAPLWWASSSPSLLSPCSPTPFQAPLEFFLPGLAGGGMDRLERGRRWEAGGLCGKLGPGIGDSLIPALTRATTLLWKSTLSWLQVGCECGRRAVCDAEGRGK